VGRGGPGGRATRWREKDGEKGAAWGRQSDRTVEMALSAAMGGGSACSQQRRGGEHGRVVRCRRRGATGRGATDR
jgi:hypothetical protein